jgi:CheY-like chemotaxis protein
VNSAAAKGLSAVPTVLVVDDESQIVELLRTYLEREGFGVAQAADGEAALREHERVRPDLVILDLMLPKLDGREVCRRIRERARTPIIMRATRKRTNCSASSSAPTTTSPSPSAPVKSWRASARCCGAAATRRRKSSGSAR